MLNSAGDPRPRVALLVPAARRSEVLTSAAIARLHEIAVVQDAIGDTAVIARQLPELLAEAEVGLTGWGTPPLTEDMLVRASRLRLIAHTAGSVKRLIPPSIFERGVIVCHAASIIADAVAEYTILAILLGLRRVQTMDHAMKSGGWREATLGFEPRQLAAITVGLAGAGYVGRKVIRLLRAFGPRILVYDPYLRPEEAAALGIEAVSLEALFRESTVVSVHLPSTPETRRLIGPRQLALLREGAVFINCARSWSVDQAALLETLRSGRIWAALDVFDEEPLPADSPFRQLDNTLLTPHQAGRTTDTYLQQGSAMVEEIERYLHGEDLRYRISPEAFARMA